MHLALAAVPGTIMREGMERLQANPIRQVLLVGRERVTADWQYILNLYQADLPPAAVKCECQQVIDHPGTGCVNLPHSHH